MQLYLAADHIEHREKDVERALGWRLPMKDLYAPIGVDGFDPGVLKPKLATIREQGRWVVLRAYPGHAKIMSTGASIIGSAKARADVEAIAAMLADPAVYGVDRPAVVSLYAEAQAQWGIPPTDFAQRWDFVAEPLLVLPMVRRMWALNTSWAIPEWRSYRPKLAQDLGVHLYGTEWQDPTKPAGERLDDYLAQADEWGMGKGVPEAGCTHVEDIANSGTRSWDEFYHPLVKLCLTRGLAFCYWVSLDWTAFTGMKGAFDGRWAPTLSVEEGMKLYPAIKGTAAISVFGQPGAPAAVDAMRKKLNATPLVAKQYVPVPAPDWTATAAGPATAID